jgi:hypothetical protein
MELYALFLVIPRRLGFICRRFGKLCLFHLPAYEDGTDRMFRNIGIEPQKPGNYPKESIQHTEHSESFK